MTILKSGIENLQSSLNNTGIGFSDIATAIAGGAGAAVGAKTIKDKISGPKGKTPPAPKGGGFWEKMFGKSGADLADAAHGKPPIPAGAAGEAGAAGKAGGWFGKMGSFLKIASKAAAPITAGMTVAENWDELKETGAVDPWNQIKKTGSGLGKAFNLDDPFFSMNRLEGVGETLSGATGAFYGAGTQIGKPISDVIPDDISDQIVDGIVSIFGGETNADRAKKQKEIEDKQAKEWEERKKIREGEKKKLEDEKKSTEEKKSPEEEKRRKEEAAILKQGQITASSANTAGAVSDTPGVNVANTADVGGLKPSPIASTTSPNIIDATAKADMAVIVNQPKDKPVPVVMTDEKGVPIINSIDRREQASRFRRISDTSTSGSTSCTSGSSCTSCTSGS